MYTQCPDCRTAFRITAQVLQQAGGRVLCGDCGHAFNALERLSEDSPQAGEHPSAEPGTTDEQKKALLDTLNELSGSDNIRIEDTGVEWRVLDEDEDEEIDSIEAGEPDAGGLNDADTADDADDTASVRWYIEDDPGERHEGSDEPAIPEPGDDLTTEAPPEATGEALPRTASDSIDWDTQEPLDLPTSAHHDEGDVERYDDNTPLPDSLDDEQVSPSEVPQRRAEDRIEPRSSEFEERQVDFALSEPEDWTDLLEEVGHERDAAGVAVADDDLGDTDIRDLHDGDDDGESRQAADFPSDIDTQFDLQALEMGIDLTGDFDSTGEQPTLIDDRAVAATEQGLHTGFAPQSTPDGRSTDDDEERTLADDDERDEPWSADGYLVLEESADPATGTDAAGDIRDETLADEREPTGEFERRIALAAEALDDNGSASEIGDATSGAAEPAPSGQDRDSDRPEHYVPPQTEEEMTINMLIDRDLLQLAEKEDVFRSTTSSLRTSMDDVPQVETIIMEGEFVRHALDAAPPPPAIKPENSAEVPAAFKDTYITNKDRMREGRRLLDPSKYAVAAGIAGLALLLAGQVVHAYRGTLATYGAFDHTVGAVYRLFGAPITPDWNVEGWQFEATNGSTASNDQILNISSRITNRSESALPYPLLHVSLTDRWEEVIGSRVLDPDEYLNGKADPDGRVAPDEKFTAAITIAGLSQEATGFKLNVCYRVNGEQLRCASGAFKN